jgi:urease accessory protein UreF
VIALVRMRLAAFLRSGRALAPIVTALVVLGIIHGGGQSPAAPAYGYSAAMLFPVLAWQAKLLLDAEPDGQRRLARLAVGARREAVAGLLAAAVFGLAFCVVAMLIPWWPFHAIERPAPGSTQPSLAAGIALGAVAHLLALPAAVALGALASRAVTRTVRNGVTVLATGAVLAVVLGLSGSVAPWLAPPVMATARALSADELPPAGRFWWLTAWTVLWCAVALGGYARLRRGRS